MAILTSPDRRMDERLSGAPAVKRRSLVAEWFAHPYADFYLVLVPGLLLLALGLMEVSSASSVLAYVSKQGDAYYFVKRQALFLAVGGLAVFVIGKLSTRALWLVSWVTLGVSVVLLLLVQSPLGVTVNGNRNWVRFGTDLLQFQPSELTKFAIVLWGAAVFARKAQGGLLDDTRHLMTPFVPVALILIALVVMQHDLGTALLLGVIVIAMLWFAGARWTAMISMIAVVGVGVLTLVATSANRMSRILGFLNQDADPFGTNHQPIRAVYALATGGWWGVGLGASRQKWGGLVEAHTDFILAVVGEELGLVGVLVVLALFATMGYAGFRIASRSTDRFLQWAAAGVTFWIMLQALVNILVVFRLAPVLGVPLPFLSYGGSALVSSLCGLGVLLACARREPEALRLAALRDGPRVTAVLGGWR